MIIKQLPRRRESHREYTGFIWAEKKVAYAMKVSYDGFTGELVKLERTTETFKTGDVVTAIYKPNGEAKFCYSLSIYDSEKKATISFTGIKLEDVKFLGGAVNFSV